MDNRLLPILNLTRMSRKLPILRDYFHKENKVSAEEEKQDETAQINS